MVEGVGGAMMTPVARLILVRTVDKRELVVAMIWVTVPALLGPMIGPVFGGFLTTYVSWHWIFIINVPIGLAGIVLATIYIEDVKAENPDPFDARGAALAGIAIAGLTFGGSSLGLNFLPTGIVIAMIVAGAAPPSAMSCMPAARRRRSSTSRCCGSRRCMPRSSAASSIAPASAACRSCCRSACSSGSDCPHSNRA